MTRAIPPGRSIRSLTPMALLVSVLAVTSCQQIETTPLATVAYESRALSAKPEEKLASSKAERKFKNVEAMSFEDFESRVSKIPGEREHYVVNGDILIIGRRNLERFFQDVRTDAAGTVGGKLLVNRIGAIDGSFLSGRPDIWDPERRKHLSYCVSDDFAESHVKVVEALGAASRDWELYADVAFIHMPDADADCVPDGEAVVFAVIPWSLDDGVLAAAPFPHEPAHLRILRVSDTYFDEAGSHGVALDGLMRHELGHVLGFDHEQNRPDAGSCFVPDDNFAMTPFDPRSVMMYPECQKSGEFSGFQLSSLDKLGAACIYGPGPEGVHDNPDCSYRAATTNATGRRVDVRWSEQAIAKSKWNYYGPLRGKPGSIATITLHREQGAGDPDLYVRFADRPSSRPRESVCSSRLDEAVEVCRLRLPDLPQSPSAAKIYIGVQGVLDSKYDLDATYVASELRG